LSEPLPQSAMLTGGITGIAPEPPFGKPPDDVPPEFPLPPLGTPRSGGVVPEQARNDALRASSATKERRTSVVMCSA
jgi:hypothetical protein